jgi:sialic acid synthase SpsE
MFNSSKCFIIAEAGTCHSSPIPNVRFAKAMRYVLAAANAGADSIKFQMFDDTKLFCPYPGDEQREPRWDNSELTFDQWAQVKEFTEACGMVFLASVFQHSMCDLLKSLNVKAVKVASRAAENFPYRRFDVPFLLSMGMDYPEERKGAIYLQCEANYPSTECWLETPHMQGFSDHSGTPWRAVDAISRGCKLIEVHFYVDPIDAGPDFPASLDLDQLKTVCEARDAFFELRSDE